MKEIKLILFVCLSAFAFTSNAQTYSGNVNDNAGNPVEFANVILLQTTDSAFVAGNVTDSSGIFTLKAPENQYIIKISAIGYKTFLQEVNQKKMGTIVLQNDTATLQEVSVTAQKKLIERKVDRLIFNVENSIAATGGDAIDALKVTPNLRVQNEQISIIGKSGVSLMVNDRILQISGEDLTNYLKSIPADNIQRIEVITTPPAKYDAEGNSGIVNIILKKAKNESWNLTLRSAFSQASYFRIFPAANFMLQTGKLSLNAGVATQFGKNLYQSTITYTYPTEFWHQKRDRISHPKFPISPNIAVNFQFSDKLSAGIQYNGSVTSWNHTITNDSYIYNNAQKEVLNKIYANEGNDTGDACNHSVNFNIIQKLDTLGKKISFDADYFLSNTDKQNPFNTINSFCNPLAAQQNYFTENNSLNNIQNFSTRIDFEMPYKWATLNYGGKLSFTQTKNVVDGKFYQEGNLYLAQNNDFTYKENNEALYFSIEKKFGKKWMAKAGLRFEATQTKGISKPLGQAQQTNDKNYEKLFPTAYLSYQHNENHTFSIDYSRRIQRPDYWYLNPARWYDNLNSYSSGNPFIQPAFVQNFDFSHTFKNLLTTQISYYYAADIYNNQLRRFENDNIIFFFDNYGTGQGFSFSENLNCNITKWWENSTSFDIWFPKQTLYSDFQDFMTDESYFGAYFSTNNTFVLNKAKTLSVELYFDYEFSQKSKNFSLKSSYDLSIGAKYQLFDKKLQLALLFSDIFRADLHSFNMTTQNVYQTYSQYFDTRFVRLTVTCKLGNSKISFQKRAGSNSEEKNRAN
ncbi:TonB-dependent receptor [Bacteroidia bacterium]|nr:TonB-dependent receptor [Bacteroidia bacterium]